MDEAVRKAPAEIRTVIEALQALRGVAQTTAATIVSELGSLSRFQSPRQLMGYSGLVARERWLLFDHHDLGVVDRAGQQLGGRETEDPATYDNDAHP